MVEAWGPDRLSCLVEALKALVEIFAEPAEGAESSVKALSVDAAPDAEVLVALFEEVIYLADVLAVVPVRFDLAETEAGGVTGRIEVVPAAATEPVGPVPKAVSYHDLQVVQEGGVWSCRAVVDI
jgi:SHS2 domain-containing protein